MARIAPVQEHEQDHALRQAFAQHVQDHKARITNMKATMGHSLLSFSVYMQWYPLYEELNRVLGKRLAYLYAYAVSNGAGCALCSTYFRKIMIESGEDPARLSLTDPQKKLLAFGQCIAKHQGHIANHVFNSVAEHYTKEELVIIVAFTGQMIATNIFNNVIETDIDEYLTAFLPEPKYC
jgi:hypothetical protein